MRKDTDVLSFVHVGDLEPDHTASLRGPDVVRALFDCICHLFRRLGRPGGADLPTPDVVLFTGDLSAGMPSVLGMRWRSEYERLFNVWRELADAGISIVWTIASHEQADFDECRWPFNSSGPLCNVRRLKLVSEPSGEIVCRWGDWAILAFGGLGGSSPKDAYYRSIARYEASPPATHLLAVSAADTVMSLPRFCRVVLHGGLQGSAPTSQKQRIPRATRHKLGRPYDWSSETGIIERLDFVWGSCRPSGHVAAHRVLAPIPEGLSIETIVPDWLTWECRRLED